jgi:hypothetical protein
MGYSIDKYVSQRLPAQLFEYAVSNDLSIHIHGVYPNHFNVLKKKFGLSDCKEYNFLPNKRKKEFNNIRPRYFICKDSSNIEGIHVLVTPGADYIYHYASMIRHITNFLSNETQHLLNIHRYPSLEKNIANWTNLDSNLINKNDSVVIGYVGEIEEYLNKHLPLKKLTSFENEYYSSKRYKIGNKTLNFLGVKYSFWGNMSSYIATKCCELGINELVYIAKQGSLTKPEDLYTKIYSATSYLCMSSLKITNYVDQLENPLVKLFPELDTNCHISVPTVLEEDYRQREIASKNYQAQSIDNEISQIAHAIYEFNKANDTKIKYFNMHFATDYIRNKNEKILETSFDLANNRSQEAKQHKEKIINKISKYFAEYVISTSI